MDNQKIRKLIKKITFCFLLFGITTMNYAENFMIKHSYVEINHSFGIPQQTWYDKTYISTNNDVITDTLSDTSLVMSSDKFGIYKTPLTTELKKRMFEVNKIQRLPNIDKILATKKKEKDFHYVLDRDTVNQKYGTIDGFEIYYPWNINEYLKHGKKNHAKLSQQISDFVADLSLLGYSEARVKFADFYGIPNIIPKKEGLEVILTLKNVGPFDVTISNPKDFQDISNDQYYENFDKKWYELKIGGLYKDVGLWMRIILLPEYLLNENLSPNELNGHLITVKSDSERVIKFLIPYNKIKVELSNGEVDTNRTKEGYIHLDHNAAIVLSNWNMYINFGSIFSKEKVWKEEKSSQVKGWVNLE